MRLRPAAVQARHDVSGRRRELYSTSGDWDLLMKVYIPEGEDIGRYINERILGIPNVERSLTTLTFKAF
jgi:DNA-binding Lrp family transcriptional regulator